MVQANTQRPRYCGECGTPLRSVSNPLGFDVFTGEPRNSESLYCPKTEVVKSGFRAKEVAADHVSYRLNTDNGTWNVD